MKRHAFLFLSALLLRLVGAKAGGHSSAANNTYNIEALRAGLSNGPEGHGSFRFVHEAGLEIFGFQPWPGQPESQESARAS